MKLGESVPMGNYPVWIGTSWKMNKALSEVAGYIDYLSKNLHASDRLQIFLVLPFTHLDRASRLLQDTPILLGAQNVHYAENGEFTGEISSQMLKDVGVDLVEIGHSERRRFFNEDDYSVNAKVHAALNHGLIPLICLGERKIERDFGVAQDTVTYQLKVALHDVEIRESTQVLVAYEPVWAIGKGGSPASPEQAGAVHALLRRILQEKYDEPTAQRVRLLYGGSVTPDNAAELLATPEVDGLFVGRAGLDPKSFLSLIRTTGLG
jgi:triosephosphate isomerase